MNTSNDAQTILNKLKIAQPIYEQKLTFYLDNNSFFGKH